MLATSIKHINTIEIPISPSQQFKDFIYPILYNITDITGSREIMYFRQCPAVTIKCPPGV